MGLTSQGEEPFEIVLQKVPTAHAEGESVVVILPAFAPGRRANEAQVRLVMSIDQAQNTEAVVRAAVGAAQRHSQRPF